MVSPAPPDSVPDTPRSANRVTFIPLSPRSSVTLRRHRQEQEAAKSGNEDNTSDSEDERPSCRDRKGKAPDMDLDRDVNPMDMNVSRRRNRSSSQGGSQDSDEEEVIEVLPDRFDAQGRPLDGFGRRSQGWTSRRGGFEYRSPRGPGVPSMRGEWGVAGTDSEAVERIVRNVTGVLEGRASWLGLLGGLLSGSLLQGPEEGDRGSQGRIEDDDDEDRRRRRRRREGGDEKGESCRRGDERERDRRRTRSLGGERSRPDGYDRDDDSDDDFYYYDDDRKRRGRRWGGESGSKA